MTQQELDPYVGRIVQAYLKDGSYHIGILQMFGETETRWGTLPKAYQIGKQRFMASDVKYCFIKIGGID